MPGIGSDNWQLLLLAPDIACLQLDTPGKSVNVLSHQTLAELDRILDQLDARNEIQGLVIASGKPGSFLAGADIDAIRHSIDESRESILLSMARSQSTLQRLSRSHYVTVAAVDGVCLGGGAELACWCDRRVLSDNETTQFGFPEVQLGLVPGWGGTARLPRLIGLDHAFEMIALDRRVDGIEAGALGLADEVVPVARLQDAAVALIRHELQTGTLAAHRQRLSDPMAVSDPEVQFWAELATRSLDEKWHGRRPAATVVQRLLLEGLATDETSASRVAIEAFADLLGSPVNVALLNVYLLREHNRRDAVVPGDVVARPVERVGIVGAGIMGIGVAVAHLKHRVPVRLADSSDEALAKAMGDIQDEAASFKVADVGHLLLRAETLEGLADCDLIVETVMEKADVKRRLYRQLEQHVSPQTVLVSNTSTIPISSLGQSLEHPGRFCGMHYFNPVRRMRLVEVVRGDQTSDATVATVVDHAKRIGKMPIVVHDRPGFLVNRLLSPYMNESLELLIAGVAIEDIDRASERFGMPLGPLALYDLVGVDTSFYAGRTLWEAFPDRIAALPILPALFRKGRLGCKSGAGFYRYEPGEKRGELDPDVPALLEPYVRRTREISEQEITERLFLPMLLEATRLLEEGIVRDVRDVDLGLIYGLGFPAERGGLLFWADTLGAAQIVAMLEPYAPLSPRFRPTGWLLDMARHGRSFYDGVPAEVRMVPRGAA